MLPYLYAFWGLTTILFFWGALIKYTSDWGGSDQQGKAFGYLEAGRGLVASIFSSLALLIVYFSSPNSDTIPQGSVQLVILFYSITTIILSFLILLFLKIIKGKKIFCSSIQRKSSSQLFPCFLIAIVVCAY